MQKKRIVALGLSLMMVASTLFGGCGQQEVQQEQKEEVKQEQQQEETKTEAVESNQEEELEPYTVTFWIYGNESKDDNVVMEEVNKKIQEVLPNTTLDLVRVAGGEYKDRWTKAMASGEKIDIGWSANWINDVSVDAGMGVVMDIEDLLKEYGQGIVEAVGGWDVMEMHRLGDGGMYFMPAWQGLISGKSGISIRKDIADLMPEGWMEETEKIALENTGHDAASIKAIMDRVEEALEVAQANDILGNGVHDNNGNFWYGKWAYSANKSIGICVTEKDGVYTVENIYESEGYKYYEDRINDWYDKGYIRSDILSCDTAAYDESYAVLKGGGLTDDWEQERLKEYGFEVEGFLTSVNNKFTTGYGTGAVIPVTSENPERAMQVLNLVYTDAEIYQLLVYGIEGTHYTKNDDGTITRPESGSRDYEGLANWTQGTCMNSLPESVDSIGSYDNLKEGEKNAVADPLAGFTLDRTGLETEWANVSAVLGEYRTSFYFDNYEDVYDEFLELLEDAGMQTIIDSYKKQLAAYVESHGCGTVAP